MLFVSLNALNACAVCVRVHPCAIFPPILAVPHSSPLVVVAPVGKIFLTNNVWRWLIVIAGQCCLAMVKLERWMDHRVSHEPKLWRMCLRTQSLISQRLTASLLIQAARAAYLSGFSRTKVRFLGLCGDCGVHDTTNISAEAQSLMWNVAAAQCL